MFDYTQEAAYEIEGLKRQIRELKEEVEDKKTKIIKRDQVNGELMAENNDLQEEIDCLQEQLSEKKTQHDGKAMMALDVKKQVMELKCRNTDLETEVGRLNMDSAATWQEGLVKFLDGIIQKKLNDRLEDLNYWSDND